MRSHTVRRFWQLYSLLPAAIQAQAQQAYTMFAANPDHPSLQFKKLNGPGEL